MKKIFFLLIMVILIGVAIPVSAQDSQPQEKYPEQLTDVQMDNALVVDDNLFSNRFFEQGRVYRFAHCDNEDDANTPCFFTITNSEKVSRNYIAPQASNAEITCGINVFSIAGILAARLQQNVNVKFWGTFLQTPLTLNWGDLRGTKTSLPFYSWNNLTGPNPNPGWGVYVPRSGTAFSTAGGLLIYQPPGLAGQQVYVSTRLAFSSSGWSCR